MAASGRMGAAPRIGIAAGFHELTMPFGVVPAHAVFDAVVEAVVCAGGTPLLLPCLAPERAAGLHDAVDGLVFTGGPDLGAAAGPRDASEAALLRTALDAGTPVLGLCRGLQLLNVVLGGSLHKHIEGHLGEHLRHEVAVTPGTWLAGLVDGPATETGSLHHQAIDRLGEGLIASGKAADGTIEAVETADGAPVLAVQWHPELERTDLSARLFGWLVDQSCPEEGPWS